MKTLRVYVVIQVILKCHNNMHKQLIVQSSTNRAQRLWKYSLYANIKHLHSPLTYKIRASNGPREAS